MYLRLTEVPETVGKGVTVELWAPSRESGVIVTVLTPDKRDTYMIHVGAEWRLVGPIQLRARTRGRLEVIEIDRG